MRTAGCGAGGNCALQVTRDWRTISRFYAAPPARPTWRQPMG